MSANPYSHVKYFVNTDIAWVGRRKIKMYRVMTTSGMWIASVRKYKDIEAAMAQITG